MAKRRHDSMMNLASTVGDPVAGASAGETLQLGQEGPPPVRLVLGDVAVDVCSEEDVYAAVRHALASPGSDPLLIGSVNLDHVHHFGTRASASVRAIAVSPRWLMVVDGVPTAIAAQRVSGRPAPRLAGSDLLPVMLAQAEKDGSRVGFLGGMPESVEPLAEAMRTRYPSLVITGHWTPPRAELDNAAATSALLTEIKDTRTDILVVGLGKPRQEVWLERHSAASGIRVGLAFGASADFLAGRVRRAPEWIRDHGLEWLYRLGLEPRRLARRYVVQGPIAMATLRMSRSNLRPPVPVPTLAAVSAAAVIAPVVAPVIAPVAAPVIAQASGRLLVLPDTQHAVELRLGLREPQGEVTVGSAEVTEDLAFGTGT